VKLKVVLEPSEEGGYTAIVPSLPGCISEGDSRDDAVRNIREAIELYLELVEDDQIFSADAELMELAVRAKCRAFPMTRSSALSSGMAGLWSGRKEAMSVFTNIILTRH